MQYYLFLQHHLFLIGKNKYIDKNKFNTMEKIVIEIRDQEGGADAKLLVQDMKNIYLKAVKNNGFNILSLTEKDGSIDLCL